MSRRLIRVFPRRTKAIPDDALARFDVPDLYDEADEVHVSVTFTYDKARAEHLAECWRSIAPTTVGGVAYGDPGAEFVPGRYVKRGYVFTSRGCPRRCWFCSVWKRDPVPRLLPIPDGWNVLDDNLLACPEPHVRAVFDMLRRQPRRAEFTGGLEALALQDYQVDLLASLRPKPTCFFAYDPGDEFETLVSCSAPVAGGGVFVAVAPTSLLRAGRLPQGHVQRGRETANRHSRLRVHTDGDAVATGVADAAEVGAGSRVASFPAAVGASSNHSCVSTSNISHGESYRMTSTSIEWTNATWNRVRAEPTNG